MSLYENEIIILEHEISSYGIEVDKVE